jgi:hypothetical protein
LQADNQAKSKLHELGKTPFNFENLRQLIGNYPNKDDAEILLSGFKFGFKTNYYGPRLPVDCKNLKSAYQHESETQQQILKEIEMGRIAGPFNERPFTNLRLSPIGVVRKKPPSTGWRLIQHLSFPLGKSVNDGIDPVFSTVHYTSFDKVLDSVAKLGRNTLLARWIFFQLLGC